MQIVADMQIATGLRPVGTRHDAGIVECSRIVVIMQVATGLRPVATICIRLIICLIFPEILFEIEDFVFDPFRFEYL